MFARWISAVTILLLLSPSVLLAFVVSPTSTSRTQPAPGTSFCASNAPAQPDPIQSVEVCESKDCRRRGGGATLIQQIQKIAEEESLDITAEIQSCDCQGECGYGPNILVNGQLINNVKGRAAILQALGGLVAWPVSPHRHECHFQRSQQRTIGTQLLGTRADDDDDLLAGEPSGVVLQDLTWRVEKLRLEEQNQQRFLKSKPRFLPYDECRKWVQAFGRWRTEEDWREWIAMGEKRNSYIPSEPDEYYGRLGQWVSWDHFLLQDPDEEQT